MKKFFIAVLMIASMAVKGQTYEPYQYGYAGMVYVAKSDSGNVITSVYGAKMDLRYESAEYAYDAYIKNEPQGTKQIKCKDGSVVVGEFFYTKKERIVLIDFIFTKVIRPNGTIEVYRNY